MAPGSDPVAAFRKLVVWASSNKIWGTDCYGRLFVTRRGHKDVLVEMRSNEDCTDQYHMQWRAEEPEGEFCDADCDASFTLAEIKTLAMLESYLARKELHVFYLPPDEEWCQMVLVRLRHRPTSTSSRCGPTRCGAAAWRLRGRHQLPFRRPDGTEVEWPGYDEADAVLGRTRSPEELIAIEAAPATAIHPGRPAVRRWLTQAESDLVGST